MRKAALFDVDGTLTSARVWNGIMGYFRTHRKKKFTHFGFVSLHYALYVVQKLGLISETGFHAQWAAHLAWYLGGLTIQEGDEVWDWVVKRFLIRHWRTDVRQILEQHLKAGHIVMLVSSGPTPLVKRIATELGVLYGIGTQFEVQAGRYTGRHVDPVCIGEYKAQEARAYLQQQGEIVDFAGSFAYADSVSDLGLLEMVGQPIPTYPNAGLRSIAEKREWAVYPK